MNQLSRVFMCSLVVLLAVAAGSIVHAQGNSAGLKIVVIEGENAVNIIQQKTATAPVVEVRDRNNQPVAGATVRFAIEGGRATFNGARTLSITTNTAGRATAGGLTPTGSGAIHIGASATFQGQTAAVTIAQTNVATASEAASAASGGGAAAGGGGMSMTTIAIIGGAAAAGGVVAVTQLETNTGSDPMRFSGVVYATASFNTSCSTGVSEGGACFANPVNGALISTTVDSTTTTTDASGHFLLTTGVKKKDYEPCRAWTLTITAAGQPTFISAGQGPSDVGDGRGGDQKYAFSPKTPESTGSPQCK